MKIKISSTNNLQISAFLHKPKKYNSTLVILLPGFLDSKDYLHLKQLGNDLSKKGFLSVRFDPLGVWESEGNISQYSVSQYLKDLSHVIQYLKKLYETNKTFLIGHSLGGMIAMLYGSLSRNKIDAIVAIMPPTTQTTPKGFQEALKLWKKDKSKISKRPLFNNPKKEKKFIVPYKYISDSKRYDVLRTIGKFKKPLLLIAGELDDKITPNEIKEIYKTAHQPKKFIVLKNTIHDYRLHKSQIKKVNKQVFNFLIE